MGDRITSTEGLKPGDVLLVSVQLTDKTTGAPFWWKTFRVVLEVSNRSWARLLTLRLEIDPEKDEREVDFRKDVVVPVLEHQMPPGVAAMFMKHLARGAFKVGGD